MKHTLKLRYLILHMLAKAISYRPQCISPSESLRLLELGSKFLILLKLGSESLSFLELGSEFLILFKLQSESLLLLELRSEFL